MDNSLFLKQLQDRGCTVATKSNNNRRSEADISISVTDRSVTVTFRNGVHEFFPSEHIGFTRFPNGNVLFIYDYEKGYSYQKSHNVTCNNRYINTGIQSKLTPALTGWEGDFNLEFDDKTGWFYITHEE